MRRFADKDERCTKGSGSSSSVKSRLFPFLFCPQAGVKICLAGEASSSAPGNFISRRFLIVLNGLKQTPQTARVLRGTSSRCKHRSVICDSGWAGTVSVGGTWCVTVNPFALLTCSNQKNAIASFSWSQTSRRGGKKSWWRCYLKWGSGACVGFGVFLWPVSAVLSIPWELLVNWLVGWLSGCPVPGS